MSLADLDVAQEMVKVHSFKSAMVNNTEVKLSLLKQNVGLSTPVQDSAYYSQSHFIVVSVNEL